LPLSDEQLGQNAFIYRCQGRIDRAWDNPPRGDSDSVVHSTTYLIPGKRLIRKTVNGMMYDQVELINFAGVAANPFATLFTLRMGNKSTERVARRTTRYYIVQPQAKCLIGNINQRGQALPQPQPQHLPRPLFRYAPIRLTARQLQCPQNSIPKKNPPKNNKKGKRASYTKA